jgi:exonuclease SbcC
LIKAIHLRNFQSHKETDIEFVPGINAIVGASNNGKTAIQRCLEWTRRNRPLGLDIVSYWNRDKQGKPKDSTSGSIELDGGYMVSRIRDKEFNGYALYRGDELIKRLSLDTNEVPGDVTALLNLSELNVQHQLDQHFLLSESPGEVAKFFNRIIKLDLIDQLQSATESRRRKYKNDLEATTIRENELKNEIQLLNWTDDAEKLLTKATKINTRIDENTAQLERLTILISKIKDTQDLLKSLEFIPTAEKLIIKIDTISVGISEKEKKLNRLSSLISEYEKHQTIIKQTPDLEKPMKLIKEIDLIAENIKNKEVKLEKLKGLIKSHEEYSSIILELENRIKILEAKLPKICPYCNSPLKEACC